MFTQNSRVFLILPSQFMSMIFSIKWIFLLIFNLASLLLMILDSQSIFFNTFYIWFCIFLLRITCFLNLLNYSCQLLSNWKFLWIIPYLLLRIFLGSSYLIRHYPHNCSNYSEKFMKVVSYFALASIYSCICLKVIFF